MVPLHPQRCPYVITHPSTASNDAEDTTTHPSTVLNNTEDMATYPSFHGVKRPLEDPEHGHVTTTPPLTKTPRIHGATTEPV